MRVHQRSKRVVTGALLAVTGVAVILIGLSKNASVPFVPEGQRIVRRDSQEKHDLSHDFVAPVRETAVYGTLTIVVRFAGNVAGATPSIRDCTCKCLPSKTALSVSTEGSRVIVHGLPPEWDCIVLAIDGNFLPLRQAISPSDVDVEQVVYVSVSRPAVMTLMATDEKSGLPVPAITLTATWEGANGRAVPRLLVTTDTSGLAMLRNLEVGRYRLGCDGPNFRLVGPLAADVGSEAAFCSVTVTPSNQWDVEGAVVGYGDKKPIAGVQVIVLSETVCRTDADGRFAIPGTFRRSYIADALSAEIVPPRGSGYSSLARSGPYAWGDRDVVIELPPEKHYLEIVDSHDVRQDLACSYCLTARIGASNTWEPLQRLQVGVFVLPWDVKWEGLVFLRYEPSLDAAAPYVELSTLGTSVVGDAVIHKWLIHDAGELRIALRHGNSPVPGASVEALSQTGAGYAATARLDPAYDPITSNPFANTALPLASGVTDASGVCTMRLRPAQGTWVRVKHPDYLAKEVVLTAPTEQLDLQMDDAGSIRGRIQGYPHTRLTLVDARGRGSAYPAVTTDGDTFACVGVPVGECHLLMSTPGSGNRPHVLLTSIIVEAQKCSEVTCSAVGLGKLLPVALRSRGLQRGDTVDVHDLHLGYSVAKGTVAAAGTVSVSLTEGSYLVRRSRSDPERGGDMSSVFAQERLSVTGDGKVFEITFPERRMRWKLTSKGNPATRCWVHVEGDSSVVRTDSEGWLDWWSIQNEIEVTTVRLTRSGWRLSESRWTLSPALDGCTVEAR